MTAEYIRRRHIIRIFLQKTIAYRKRIGFFCGTGSEKTAYYRFAAAGLWQGGQYGLFRAESGIYGVGGHSPVASRREGNGTDLGAVGHT